MKTLLLVDASSYLYRAFHALPDLRTKAGEATGAIYGVLNMLRRLHKDVPADYSACVFDAKGKTFRDEWYPQYKATRTAMPDELGSQIEPLHECIRAVGWPLLEVGGVEADDVIGTLAVQATEQGMRIVISSSDKDLAQLVSPHITIINTMSNEKFDEAGVFAKFGVKPAQMIDYLTLIGDSVDNIPGVDKVGPKTACKLLAQYGSLDNLMAHADAAGGVGGENLRKVKEWLPQARRLLTIKCDVALEARIEDLNHQPQDKRTLARLFERYEFQAWRRELGDDADLIPLEVQEREYETVLDVEALARWLAKLESSQLTAFAAQTTSFDPMTAELVGFALSIEKGKAAYVPLAHRYTGAPSQLDRNAVLAQLRPWLENPAKLKAAHGSKFQMHVLANHGIDVAGIAHDTMLESYVLASHRPNELDGLAQRHLHLKTLNFEEVCGKGAGQICFDQVPIDRATQYAAEDADVTLQLHHALYPEIEADRGLSRIYNEIEVPVARVLFAMERHGVLIDTGLLEAHGME